MKKFLDWIEDTYGYLTRFLVLFTLGYIGVAVSIVLIVFTYGAALLLVPAALAWLFVKFRREQGK